MNTYSIYVIEQMGAPPRMRYAAAFRPLDDGESCPPTGEGPTEQEAIADLVLNHNLELA